MEDSAAAQQAVSRDGDVGRAATPVVSSAGLTEAQLDEYAAQLQAEAARLDAYRVKLSQGRQGDEGSGQGRPVHAAARRQADDPAGSRSRWRSPLAKPVAKPAPKPVAKPQSNTKSS